MAAAAKKQTKKGVDLQGVAETIIANSPALDFGALSARQHESASAVIHGVGRLGFRRRGGHAERDDAGKSEDDGLELHLG